jgi:GNAT superfamily N-acetyltransferase
MIKFSDILKENNVLYSKMNNKDIEIIKANLSKIFYKTGLSNENIWGMIGEFDSNKSVVVKVNNELAGFYFIGNSQIPPGGKEYDELKNLKGVEGIALGVLPKFKNQGIGKKLIEYPKTLGIDYIWGYQLKSLQNIDNWLKRRKIYWENPQIYITYQIF